MSDINEVNDSEVSPQKIELEKPVKPSGLKSKKVMDEVLPAKTKKIEFSDDSSQSSLSGSERGENSGLDPTFVPSNKSDPKKDRRKDRMRQIRKDPDAGDEDFILEDYENESSPVRSKKKKIESRENKPKMNKKSVKPVKKVSGDLNKIVMQVKSSNPDISKLGRIPKKGERKVIKIDDGEKKTKLDAGDKNQTSDKKEKLGSKTKESDKDISKSKDRHKSPEKDAKSSASGKSDSTVKKPSEIRKPPPPEIKRDSKKYNISVEARKLPPGESRPKTVKTFNSKFRSTGLEEELPPPPAQKSSKKVGLPPLLLDKKPVKRISPVKEVQPPEKKAKAESNEAKKPTANSVDKSPVPAAAATVSVPKQSPVSKTKCKQLFSLYLLLLIISFFNQLQNLVVFKNPKVINSLETQHSMRVASLLVSFEHNIIFYQSYLKKLMS
ncbi:hypothetical protein LSTR_LSTR016156 [Laodelphax striatellus]|uniref:Uncharacterized protein n=1 Tax=Laodelphax striatellus TaxID=195883 RepID=A0A482X0I8_LAOST|nr:hypothetical protein LSTR_LSTR016156 [Laodelphax striatellus]